MGALEQKHIRLIGALSSPIIGGWYLSKRGFNLYQLDAGDTLQSLASRYLGDANRWPEIWAMQTPQYQESHDPNNLAVGEQLYMPQAAIDAAKAAGEASGGLGAAPSKFTSGKTLDPGGTDVLVPHGGGGSVTPTPTPATPAKPTPTPSTPPASGGLSTLAKLAIGGIAVAAAGGAVAFGVHHFKKRKSNPRRGRRAHARRRNGNVRGVDVERVRLNRGGYDSRGRYWGVGEPLYSVYVDATGRYTHVRAKSAKEARAKVAGAR
jgi:hypothetical protein